ncbi:MAG: YchJ family protein [Deltaproteobacteria bacterium]|nr:YchJ family protein [Deltaproteobacteria bacterium]
MRCPCGSNRTYDDCCGPYLEGRSDPPTAEALMRSRYTAYSQAAIDYLLATHDPPPPPEEVKAWAERAEFLSLQIVGTRAGGALDDEGEVEFLARYREAGVERVHHERSQFQRRQGRWCYVERLASPKVGRNDPCPCGSGKKYKKCCAA